VVQQEAERAANIVRNLLSFARKQEHQRRPTAIRPLLTATLGLLRNQLMADKVEAKLDVEPDLPEIDVDANQIQQVFVNLINNASQAIATTGRPGTVTVRVRRWIDGVVIEVIDDGPGMAAGDALRAFEPFFTTKPEGQGTGLGLSISQGIVKEHGGRISLSTIEGQGATLTVELPQTLRLPPESAPETVPDAGRPLHVLVVDDEAPILHYMRATLEAWGHTVATASDGNVALQLASRGDFDLIITDLRMPRLGGREFYEELRRRAPAIAERIAFSTGDTVRGDTLAFLERQGRPCLHKPFSLAELRRLLGSIGRPSPSAPPSATT
jgi:two-component system NtrC family sensor kinase